MDNFYLTTTIPYINSSPHMGTALEMVQADARVRYERQKGKEVFFNMGVDEHGIKISQSAAEEGISEIEFSDRRAKEFQDLYDRMECSYTTFTRTTSVKHREAAQKFWNVCLKNGDIYKAKHEGKYCIGCELYITESDLVNGKCQYHPKRDVVEIEEENYFFKFSKYQQKLLDLYDNPDFCIPQTKAKEIKSFVEGGLKDFSISRQSSKLSWGVPVPNDPTQTMYVWFDALINYVSAIGWGSDASTFQKWWPVVQVAGKDNLRQQCAIWQAMLLSAGLEPSKQVYIHGFITQRGAKMSKSSGDALDPNEFLNIYGVDAVRFFFLCAVNPYEDTDISRDMVEEFYNGVLVKGIGNVVSRVMTLAAKHISSPKEMQLFRSSKEYDDCFETFNIKGACEGVLKMVHEMDKFITEKKPFDVIKTNPEEGREQIEELRCRLYQIATLLLPMMPKSAETILLALKDNECPPHLFPRMENESVA